MTSRAVKKVRLTHPDWVSSPLSFHFLVILADELQTVILLAIHSYWIVGNHLLEPCETSAVYRSQYSALVVLSVSRHTRVTLRPCQERTGTLFNITENGNVMLRDDRVTVDNLSEHRTSPSAALTNSTWTTSRWEFAFDGFHGFWRRTVGSGSGSLPRPAGSVRVLGDDHHEVPSVQCFLNSTVTVDESRMYLLELETNFTWAWGSTASRHRRRRMTVIS